MSRSVPPPSQHEVARKLSLHSAAKPPKKPSVQTAPVSGTESDSDSVFSPDLGSPSPISASLGAAVMAASSSQHPPLSSIAERRSASGGEESEEDDQGEDEGWRVETETGQRDALHDRVLKTGYLWKKGERRKTWKKRWFVLRPAHLAFYKTNAEYKLLRLLDLSDVHSCTPVTLKNHANTFGLVSPTRTFYLQASNQTDVHEWVQAISEARQTFLATSTQNSANGVPIPMSTTSAPIPIPRSNSARRGSVQAMPISVSPSQSHSPHGHHFTSSESEDASPSGARSYNNTVTSPPTAASGDVSSPSKQPGAVIDASKVILSGYLMKCGSRRHIWHNRWFVLSGEKLMYCRSHMDTKPHRQIPLSQILDALEYDLPSHRNPGGANASPMSPPQAPVGNHHHQEEHDGKHRPNTFKVVTTKRPLLLSAPSEEEEIKWLSAIRALIARRSGAGVVPGDSASAATAASVAGHASSSSKTTAGVSGSAGSGTAGTSAAVGSGPPGNADASAATLGGGGSGLSGANAVTGTSTGGRRRDSIARRLSASGGGGSIGSAAAAGIPVGAAAAAATAQEVEGGI